MMNFKTTLKTGFLNEYITSNVVFVFAKILAFFLNRNIERESVNLIHVKIG